MSYDRGIWLLSLGHGCHLSLTQEDSVEVAEAHAWNWPTDKVPVAIFVSGEVLRYRRGWPQPLRLPDWHAPSPAEVVVALALAQCVVRGDACIGGPLDVPQLTDR